MCQSVCLTAWRRGFVRFLQLEYLDYLDIRIAPFTGWCVEKICRNRVDHQKKRRYMTVYEKMIGDMRKKMGETDGRTSFEKLLTTKWWNLKITQLKRKIIPRHSITERQRMIGVSNHLSKVSRFHHSQFRWARVLRVYQIPIPQHNPGFLHV